jgi:hypothetical protein
MAAKEPKSPEAPKPEAPKPVGRTLWDFLISIVENRSVSYIFSGLALLAVVGIGAAIQAGWVTVQVKGFSGAGPSVNWNIQRVASIDMAACDKIAEDTLRDAAGNVSEKDEYTKETARIAMLPHNLIGWINCVQTDSGVLAYTGVAGTSDEGKDLVIKLSRGYRNPLSN